MSETSDPGHLNLEAVRRFGRRELDRSTLFETAWHLFLCPRCRTLLEPAGPEAEALFAEMFGDVQPLERAFAAAAEEPAGAPGVDPAPERPAVGRLAEELRRAGLVLERERGVAPLLYRELAGRPLTTQLARVATEPRFHTYGLAEHLLAECRRGWSDDPGRAESSAELALAVIGELDRDVLGDVLLNDLRAEAWSYIANCRRIRFELDEVAAAFAVAEEMRAHGSGDPIEEAALLDLKASYLREQRELRLASAALDRAIVLYTEANDLHLAGRALIKKATLVRLDGRVDEAIELLETAREQIDPEREPQLLFLLRKNLALYLSETGREEEAAAMLPELRKLAREQVGRLELCRLRWAEGLIYRRLGRHGWAENALRRARDGFVEQSIGYDAALVSLDLAGLYLDTGRQSEARHLAAEMIPIFAARDVHREAVAAVAIFARAVWEDRMTRELVQRVVGYLHEARYNPALRFDPSAPVGRGDRSRKH